jgi:hypothetical protein
VPSPLTGAEAANLAKRREERKQRDLEAEQKRMELPAVEERKF